MASSSSSFRLKQQQQQQRERPKSRREALIEKYVERPRTHQLALEQADTTCIRTGSPVRYSPARRFEHVVTSVFGAGGSPKIPKGADNDWCTKGLVIAGESCSPVLQRLSHPTNFTKSYTKRRSYPHVADINELTAFPRYSERDTEYLESLRIRKFVAEERRNPEVCASSHAFCLNVQSNRNLFRHPLSLVPLSGKGQFYQRCPLAAVFAARAGHKIAERGKGACAYWVMYAARIFFIDLLYVVAF